MNSSARPHDLLWLATTTALASVTDPWVAAQWHVGLPVVVRRDRCLDGRIPVGVRGARRDQRAAGWVNPAQVIRRVAPESLVQPPVLRASAFVSMPPIQAALILAQQTWPWAWGVTGSAGYALATTLPVMHASSDLDVLIRAPAPLDSAALEHWQQQLAQLPCRADTQVETPYGAFLLTEWLRAGRVLLRTDHGPLLVDDPWRVEV